MKKILVTGAGGFLGRHLCKMMEASGYEVVRLYHADLDITDRAAATWPWTAASWPLSESPSLKQRGLFLPA